MKPKSWDGNAINDGTNFRSIVRPESLGLPNVESILSKRGGAWPRVAGLSRPGRHIILEITIVGGTIATNRNNLFKMFDPEDETAKKLIVEDDAGGNDRYIYGVCESASYTPESSGLNIVVFIRVDGDVRWRENTATTPAAWNVNDSGETNNFTNNGSDDAYPIITITPGAQKTGDYSYKRWCPVRWNLSTGYVRYPTDIVGAGLDTATLISGGKLQADGDDLRVMLGDTELEERWLGYFNQATSRVWVNLDWLPKQEVTLDVAISDTGEITEIYADASIAGFPERGLLMIDSECFEYKGRDLANDKFLNVTRSMRGTTRAAHTTSDTIWWIQFDLWIIYGNSGASAPDTDDTYKPIFDLDSSTNTSWDFTEFGTDAGGRAGAIWSNTGSEIEANAGAYTANHNTNATPWSELGLWATKGSAIQDWWEFKAYHPAGILNANFQNGEKYASSVTEWDGTIAIESSDDEAAWDNEYSITAPGSPASWEGWSRDEALTAGAKYVRMHMNPGWDLTVRQLYLEASRVTLTLDSTYTPGASLGSERGEYLDYAYKCWVPVRWMVAQSALKYPIDIANDGLDTDALITAGKMQDFGEDLRVRVNGIEVDRWLDGIDTSSTKVWVNLDFAPKQEAALLTPILSSGTVDVIDVDEEVGGFPDQGILMINDEAFSYTGKNNALKRFTGVTRAAKGTTAQGHVSGAVVWWVQQDVYILYGNDGVEGPILDNSQKPVFSLASSTNGSWDYDEFGDEGGERSGKWGRGGGDGDAVFYTASQDTNADPWAEMGIRNPDGVYAWWALFNPCGITAANFANGEKWAASVGAWDGAIQSSQDGAEWVVEDTIAAPSSASTYEAWSDNETLETGSNRVRLVVKSDGSNINKLEVADVTVTINATFVPVISIGDEQGNYSLKATITNNTTGDAIKIDMVMEMDEDLVVDSDEKTVIYDKDGSNQYQALTVVGGARRDWLKLQPGVNALQYDDEGTSDVDVALSWEERHYQ